MQKRKKLFVDRNVQGAIVKRVLVYWGACVCFLTLPQVLMRAAIDPSVLVFTHIPAVVVDYWPVYVVSLTILPFAVVDALRLSNRFVGPVMRIRTELSKYNRGDGFRLIELRQDDFWADLADEVNSIVDDHQKLKEEHRETSTV